MKRLYTLQRGDLFLELSNIIHMEIVRSIQNRIYEIRGERVMLDFDLAELYEVATKVLNQSVKRNLRRFPEDFMFRLTLSNGSKFIYNLRLLLGNLF